MSSRSLNKILIKTPLNYLTLYLLHILYVLFYRELFVYICTRRDDVRRVHQRYFIYCSIFAISELRKRRVQGHCAAYHFRIPG